MTIMATRTPTNATSLDVAVCGGDGEDIERSNRETPQTIYKMKLDMKCHFSKNVMRDHREPSPPVEIWELDAFGVFDVLRTSMCHL